MTEDNNYGKPFGKEVLKGAENSAFIENTENEAKFKLSNEVTS